MGSRGFVDPPRGEYSWTSARTNAGTRRNNKSVRCARRRDFLLLRYPHVLLPLPAVSAILSILAEIVPSKVPAKIINQRLLFYTLFEL